MLKQSVAQLGRTVRSLGMESIVSLFWIAVLNLIVKWLVSFTLIEMMVAIGLGVTWNELIVVSRNWRLILASVFTNYICVPLAALVLVLMLKSPPLIGAGVLILAVCPGSSYGPPMTSFGKGNLATAVGLMIFLAGSSVILAPLLLYFLLPLASGREPMTIDLAKMFAVLLVTQFAPLCIGLSIRHWQPNLAKKLKGPADSVGLILNVVAITWIVAMDYSLFAQLDLRGLVGMTALLLISLVAGWQMGGSMAENRKTLALTTSLRNTGLGLVIASAAFPGMPAVMAVLGYALFEIVGSLLLAVWWHRTGTA